MADKVGNTINVSYIDNDKCGCDMGFSNNFASPLSVRQYPRSLALHVPRPRRSWIKLVSGVNI